MGDGRDRRDRNDRDRDRVKERRRSRSRDRPSTHKKHKRSRSRDRDQRGRFSLFIITGIFHGAFKKNMKRQKWETMKIGHSFFVQLYRRIKIQQKIMMRIGTPRATKIPITPIKDPNTEAAVNDFSSASRPFSKSVSESFWVS